MQNTAKAPANEPECEAAIISDWLLIDQDRIDLFSRATNDPDPFHIDPKFAAENSRFGTTISFGFLTMSLLTFLYRSIPDHRPGFALNYGFNRLRLTAPVKVNSRVRGVFRLVGCEDRGEGKSLRTYHSVIEVEGQAKPALVAEWLAMWIDDSGNSPHP